MEIMYTTITCMIMYDGLKVIFVCLIHYILARSDFIFIVYICHWHHARTNTLEYHPGWWIIKYISSFQSRKFHKMTSNSKTYIQYIIFFSDDIYSYIYSILDYDYNNSFFWYCVPSMTFRHTLSWSFYNLPNAF